MAIETKSATVTVKAQAQTKNGDSYWRIDLLVDDSVKALTYSMFGFDVPFEQGDPIKVGETWTFGLEERDNGSGGVYRNIKALGQQLQGATPQSVAKAQATPSEGNEQATAKARSSALHAAVAFASAKIAGGMDVSTKDLLRVADSMCRWQGVEPYGTPQETAPDGRSAEEWPEPVEESADVENERLHG